MTVDSTERTVNWGGQLTVAMVEQLLNDLWLHNTLDEYGKELPSNWPDMIDYGADGEGEQDASYEGL